MLFLGFTICARSSEIFLYALGQIETHRLGVCHPKAPNTITLVALPFLTHSTTDRLNKIFICNANGCFLLSFRLGEFEASRLVALAHTDGKDTVFCVKLTEHIRGIAQVLNNLFGKGNSVLIDENVGVHKQKCILMEENENLTSLRNWLLPMLMNGQATVSD